MDTAIAALPFAGSLLVGMMICMEVCRFLGLGALARDPAGSAAGTGPLEGALFGLFGLLIANEENDIGTASLRIDLLTKAEQPEMRRLFRSYLDSRLTFWPARSGWPPRRRQATPARPQCDD